MKRIGLIVIALLLIGASVASIYIAQRGPTLPFKTLDDMTPYVVGNETGLCSGAISAPGVIYALRIEYKDHIYWIYFDSEFKRFVVAEWKTTDDADKPRRIYLGHLNEKVIVVDSSHAFNEQTDPGPCPAVYPKAADPDAPKA